MAGTGNILSAQINVTLPAASVAAFEKTAAASVKTTAALQRLPQTANAATQSMTNLGRVVQDAPFGFLGIANNLNPLLESFQRLKVQAGSNVGALKALGSSLMGAGGLGFALSIVSTGLILFGDKLFSSGKKAKEAASEADKFKESIKGIFSETAKEAAQAGALVAVLKSETETRERKLVAIKELQRIQPEIFAGLKLEGETVIGLDLAYQNYIKNLSTVIAVKIKQSQLEALITKQLQLQGVTLTQVEQRGIKIAQDFNAALEKRNKIVTNLAGKKISLGEGEAAIPIIERQNKAIDEQKTLEQEIASLLKDITELSKGVKLPGFKDAVGDVAKIKKGISELAGGDERGILIDVRAGDVAADFNVDNFDLKAFNAAIQKIISKNPLIVNIPIDPKIILNAEQVTQQAEIIESALENIITEGLSGIGEAIGEGLAGGDISKGIKSFLSSIAGAIQGLGKQLIAFAVAQKLALEAAKKFNPVITAAAGLALVVIGAAMRKAISGSTGGGFAEGGYTGAGGKYQAAGVVHKGEFVIPNYAVNRLGVGFLNNLAFGSGVRGYAQGGFVSGGLVGGGIAIEITGENVTRGQDIVTVYKAALRSQGRLT